VANAPSPACVVGELCDRQALQETQARQSWQSSAHRMVKSMVAVTKMSVRHPKEMVPKNDTDDLDIGVARVPHGTQSSSLASPRWRTTLLAKRTAASASMSFDTPLRFAIISVSSSFATFWPRYARAERR